MQSVSRRMVDFSSKEHPSLHLEATLVTFPQEPHSKMVVNGETIRRDSAPALA